jgi:hypothetical protein
MSGKRLVLLLLLAAALAGVTLALVMKQQKRAFRARHPSEILPLR